MAGQWIVKRGERQAGPYTSPQLRSLALSGQLRRTDLVTRQGSGRFVKAEEVRGLSFAESAGEEDEDIGTVEIIDDGPVLSAESDGEAVIIVEPVDEPVIVIEPADDLNVVDYDYDAEQKRKPMRSRRGRGFPRTGRNPSREAVEKGPRLPLISGVMCLVVAVVLFLYLDADPDINDKLGALGGKWLISGFFVAVGLGSFWISILRLAKQ